MSKIATNCSENWTTQKRGKRAPVSFKKRDKDNRSAAVH